MIKTRIFQIVGHIHNMQLCIEMISFINHENESILRWFYSFCEPRNFSLCPRSLVGVYSGGLGVWFMTFCCCLVEFGSSCFNHAWIESWFVWFGPWYTTQPSLQPSTSRGFMAEWPDGSLSLVQDTWKPAWSLLKNTWRTPRWWQIRFSGLMRPR